MLRQKQIFGWLLVFAVLLVCSMPQASAQIDKWSDNNYPFKRIRAIYVEDISLNVSNLSDIEQKNLRDDFRKQIEKIYKDQSYRVVTDRATYEALARNNPNSVVYAKTVMDEYRLGSYVVPAHTEWRTRTIRDHYYDREGKRHEITRNETYPEFVPERTIYTDTIHMRLDVYDSATNQVIFSRDEHRTDDNSRDLKGMFGEISRGCLRDFRKKISDD